MKQLDDNIDIYFKSKVDKAILDLNKEKAWERLQKQRTKINLRFVTIAIAASLILGFLFIISNKPQVNNENDMTKFEKRQKLKEYESKISGTYVETILCYDCNGSILKSQIKQVPENRWIFKMY